MKKDNRILKISFYATLLFSIISLAQGICLNSNVLIFDGIYCLLCAAVIIATLGINVCINKYNLHDKKESIELVIVLFKYLLLIVICLYTSVTSASVLLNAKIENSANPALIYMSLSTLCCYSMFIYIDKHGSKSNIIKMEAKQWFLDTILSGTILLSHICIFILNKNGLSNISGYIEPIVSLIISTIFLIENFNSLYNEFYISFIENKIPLFDRTK